MTGNEQRLDLVARLPVGDRLAGLLITGVQQNAQQISPVESGPTALGNQVVDQSVQGAARLEKATLDRDRRVLRNIERRIQPVVEVLRLDGDGLFDGVR